MATIHPMPSAGALSDALARFLQHDAPTAQSTPWLDALQQLGESLGGHPVAMATLVRAWSTFFTLTTLLDHLQDGDGIDDDWFASLPPPIQYHLIFSAYVDAQQLLTTIDPEQVSHARLTRLQQHWAACVAQIAAGQYRDLTQPVANQNGAATLDVYEEIIAAKAGATFALAFGGVAILATDDDVQIAAATQAGQIIGMLLQYQDDRHDAEAQLAQPATITLGRAFQATVDSANPTSHEAIFWALILTQYRQALTTVIAPLPLRTQQVIQDLATAMFGPPFTLPLAPPQPGIPNP